MGRRRIPDVPNLPQALAAIGLAAFASLPAAALAQARPTTMPTRDVDVTYQMAAPGPSGKVEMLSQRMRWEPASGLLRVDPPSQGIYTIMDYHAHKLLVVDEPRRSVTLMHAAANVTAPGVSPTAQFTREGQAQVAGLACTDWQTRDSTGQPTTVCLTDDGVLLRARRGDHVLVQAVTVSYAPVDPGVFKVPAGYHEDSPPQ